MNQKVRNGQALVRNTSKDDQIPGDVGTTYEQCVCIANALKIET